MHYFNSTALSAARYDRDTKTLTIWFTSGGQAYDYYGVPVMVYEGLITAASAGEYFNAYIRDQYAA